MSETERPLVENSASASQVRAARKKARFTDRQRRDRWQSVLDTPNGRFVLSEIIQFCGPYRNGYKPGDEQQYDAGMKNVASFIVTRVEEARPDRLGELLLSTPQTRSQPKPTKESAHAS